jgi:hypothetical protein
MSSYTTERKGSSHKRVLASGASVAGTHSPIA